VTFINELDQEGQKQTHDLTRTTYIHKKGFDTV